MNPLPVRFATSSATLFVTLFALACGGESQASTPQGESPSMTSMQALQTSADGPSAAPENAPQVLVYKSPTCGCCAGWVEHLREQGYDVTVQDRNDIDQIKDMLGIPLPLRSCHTAEVGKYLVEGHVPASDIRRLIEDSPQIAGIAAPGMPMGSPGMEVEGRPADHYDVLAFDADGETSVFASH